MTDAPPAEDATLFPKTAGERLREAREAQGLSLAEIAARTRVPVRHLEAIETDDFKTMPSVTYAVGFAKAYARAVGIDEVAIAREVRSQDIGVRRTEYEQYEIDEPSRTPSFGLAVAAGIVVALLLLAVGLWYGTNLFRGGPATPVAATDNAEIMPPAPVPSAAPAPAAAVPASGQVVLTATDEVWMRVYDATGKTLFLNTLKPGEKYDVPSDANGPMINVGRPDKLQVTLNGSALPPLGSGRVAIKDVPIGAAALSARANGTPTPTPTPASKPAGRETNSPPPAFRSEPATAPARSPGTQPRVSRPNATLPSEVAPVPVPAPAATNAPNTNP